MPNSPTIRDNIHFLHQAIELIAQLDDKTFTQTDLLYPSGIGSHLRHCIDHYRCFINGVEDNKIDYDGRKRDPRLETDSAYAARELSDICHELERLPATDQAVQSKMDCGSVDQCPFSDSTIKRELQFLISHTVHHYALIAMILRHQGIALPPQFGIAPSTIKYEQNSASCAP
jgi:uncharacterized damage-inducible protein DinB